MKTEKILTIVLVVLLLLIAVCAGWIIMNIQNITDKSSEQPVIQTEERTAPTEKMLPETEPAPTVEQTEEETVAETAEETTEETRPQFLDAEGNVTILGMVFPQDAVEIDLTDVIARAEGQTEGDKTAYEYSLESPVMGQREEVPTSMMISEAHPYPDKQADTARLIAEVEAAMEYLPNAEKLIMYGAWLDNEKMAQFRENHREDYKVVWSVRCGPLAAQTDARSFMPTKHYVVENGFADWHAYNLRYCEEMVCMDFGHMLISDLEFAAYMPELKYLIITLTPVYDVTPLANCKKLVFLEMDWSYVTDYSPLQECTALEDLNIGETYGKIDPVLEMTWLKNLWLVGMKQDYYNQAAAALPDTNIGYYYGNPDDGWRELPNYFAMRDELKMFYME